MPYDSYDLFGATDAHLTRPRIQLARSKSFYPSEASVKVYDNHGDEVVHGGCLRASYFRLSGEFEGTPHDERSMFIFGMGNKVEDMLIETWKEMGIWVDNNVKFVDEENNISGEIDVILAEPPSGQLYGVEVKSFYGYMAEKELFGGKGQPGFPKMNHLLQTLVYLNHLKSQLPYFRIAYFGRDSVKRRTFKVELHQEGEILYPKVEGNVLRQFSIADILARYKELSHYLETNTVPPNDFELQYDNAKVEDFYKKGKVAKTKYEKWQKGKLGKFERVGDWQCAYCQYKDTCWGS